MRHDAGWTKQPLARAIALLHFVSTVPGVASVLGACAIAWCTRGSKGWPLASMGITAWRSSFDLKGVDQVDAIRTDLMSFSHFLPRSDGAL